MRFTPLCCVYDQVICFKHWVQHHGLVRLDKAAARIQVIYPLPCSVSVLTRSTKMLRDARCCVWSRANKWLKKKSAHVEYQLSPSIASVTPTRTIAFGLCALVKRHGRLLDDTACHSQSLPYSKRTQALLRSKKARVLVQSILTARKSQGQERVYHGW